jgi:type I restriction enzyme S subunit
MIAREIPLGAIALPKGGFVDGPFGSNLKASEYVEAGVPIMRLQNIRPNEFVPKDIKFISAKKAGTLSRHMYRPGDVVIAKLGAVGTACLVPAYCEPGVIVADVVRFRGDPREVSHQYLSHFLSSPEGQRRILRLSKGTTRLRTNLTDLRSVLVPLPHVDDQIRIAHLLGKVEGLIAQRKQHLQQLDDLLKSVFLEMFGDPVRNVRGWNKPELKAFGRISTGNTPPRNDPTNYSEDFIEWIKTNNINGDTVFVTASLRDRI